VLPFNRFAARLTPPPTPTEHLLAEINKTLKSIEQASVARE